MIYQHRPVLFLALFLLFAASLLNRLVIPIAGLNLRPEHFLAPLVFAWYALYRLLAHRRPLFLHRYNILAAAWLGLNLLSSLLFAPDRGESLKHIVRLSFMLAVFFTVAHLPLRARRWTAALQLWLSLGLAALLYGLAGWVFVLLTGRPVWGVFWPANFPYLSVEGTFSERNFYGILAGTSFIMFLTIWLGQWRGRRAILYSWRYLLAGLLISGTALVVSLTRSAWIAVAVVALLAGVTTSPALPDRLRRALLLTIIGLPLALALLFFILVAFPESSLAGRLASFTQLAADPTWGIRLQDARVAVQDWLARPLLGNGTGSFAQLHGIRAGTEAWISNLVLHSLVDVGLVGLLVQLALIGLIWRDAGRAARRAPTPALGLGLAALQLGLVTILITYQLTDGTWLALFWIHLGLMANGCFIVGAARRTGAVGS